MCEQYLQLTDANADSHLDSYDINRSTVLVALDTIYIINHYSLACLGDKCDHWWAIRRSGLYAAGWWCKEAADFLKVRRPQEGMSWCQGEEGRDTFLIKVFWWLGGEGRCKAVLWQCLGHLTRDVLKLQGFHRKVFYIDMCVYLYIYMYIHTHIHKHTCIYICVCGNVHLWNLGKLLTVLISKRSYSSTVVAKECASPGFYCVMRT